jgi:hypothetical protein
MSFWYNVLLFGGTFVGVVVGHNIVRSIIGGGTRGEPVQYQQTPQAPVPCQSESHQLGQCIDFANKDISKCQVYMDLLISCQQRQKY